MKDGLSLSAVSPHDNTLKLKEERRQREEVIYLQCLCNRGGDGDTRQQCFNVGRDRAPEIFIFILLSVNETWKCQPANKK